MSKPLDMLGMRIGAYEVQSVLGSGGMATVYRGFDHNLLRPVAIKVLSEGVAQPDFVERFRQEARLIARLRHPHIVRIYDLIEQDGILYMIQELLAGKTLAERLSALATQQQLMPRREILATVQQLASALDAAHAAGIIHRDVKPHNILYNADGALVLTDFGIAKSTATDSTKTQTGMVLGTPTYISPEQARGEAITPASDIYALGVVLYILISGQPPFDGWTPLEIVIKHLNEPAPLLQPLRESVTPQVDAVVQRALAKRPEDRFTTAVELAQALARAWPEPRGAAAPSALQDVPTSALRTQAPPIVPVLNPSTAASLNRSQTTPVGAGHSAARRLAKPSPRYGLWLALILVGAMLSAAVLAWYGQPEAGAQALPQARDRIATQEALAAGPQSVAALRGILGSGATTAMRTSLDTAERALLANDQPRAARALGVLQRQILAARQDGSLSAEAMNAALVALQELAERNNLRLPLQIEPRSGHRLDNLLYYQQS